MPSTFRRIVSTLATPFKIERLGRVQPQRPELAPRRAASDSAIDYATLMSVAQSNKAEHPGVRPPLHPTTSFGPRGAPIAPMTPAQAATIAVTEIQVQDLELRAMREMGPWALQGLRYTTLIGTAVATTVGVVFGVVPLIVPLMPGIGAIVFVGILVSAVLVGAVAQALARRAYFRRSSDIEPLLTELNMMRANMERRPLTMVETRLLRRLQVLENDIRGGFRHSLWSILYGVSAFDPALRGMMAQASDHVPGFRQPTAPMGAAKGGFRAWAQAARAPASKAKDVPSPQKAD